MESRYERLQSIQKPKPISQTENFEQPVSTWRHHLSYLPLLVIQLLGLIWLAPIILLLYINFKGHIIGPSALCPSQGCKTDSPRLQNSKWRLELDHNDHNILGTLQLVAKALEIWFFFVAGNLVYNIAMLAASLKGGLPIGLFSSPMEFSDPRSLYQMFRAATSDPVHSGTKERLLLKPRLYYLVSFLLLMCLLVNLMGPAVAVLVLPTLQWIDLPLQAQHSFNVSAIGEQPRGIDFKIFPNCSSASLADRLYSCTSKPYAASLDSLTDTHQASEHQMSSAYGFILDTGASPEGTVGFGFNRSDYGGYVMGWAPNRQTLREISADYEYFLRGSWDPRANPGYRQYNQSLGTVLKRKGPIFGAVYNPYGSVNTTIVQLAPNKEIRCYDGYQLGSDPRYFAHTKCLRLGTAWTALNKGANFKLIGAQNRSVNARVFFSDRAAIFDRDLTSNLISPSCFVNGILTSPNDCDFEALFSANGPAHFSALSSNILSVEWSMSQDLSGSKFIMEFLTFADFATYVLDTSSVTNPLQLVRIEDAPDVKDRGLQTIPVDPDWFLAAWSVDQGGFVTNRSSSTALIRFFEADYWGSFSDIGSLNRSVDNGSLSSTSITSGSIINKTTTPSVSDDIEIITITTFTIVGGGGPTASSHPSADGYYDFLVTSSASPTRTSSQTDSVFVIPTASLSPSTDEIGGDFGQSNQTTPDNSGLDDILGLAIGPYSYLQALSMITYSQTNLTHPNHDTNDVHHPTLWYWARVHVWAYGTGSRTSKMGIVVTMLGGICVIASFILGLMTKRRQKSITDLLIAAVEHTHQGELHHVVGKQALKKKVRYRFRKEEDGVLRFDAL